MARTWTNGDNVPFYARLGIEGLFARARLCGLMEAQDVEAIAAFLQHHAPLPQSPRVLEIGAGFGRVADGILRRYPGADVTLVELCAPSAAFLRERYRADRRVRLHAGSILQGVPATGFDLALWMWAGFLDCAPEEKALALSQITERLVPGGHLMIEVPRTVGTEVRRDEAGRLLLQHEGTEWRGEVPSASEVRRVALRAGLFPITEILYETGTKLQRTIHVFQKAHS